MTVGWCLAETIEPQHAYTVRASTAIRLDEDGYERLRSVERDDESFSEALDRLLGGGSLLDLDGRWSEETTGEVQAIVADTDEASVIDG